MPGLDQAAAGARPDVNLAALFVQQAHRTPDDIALIADRSWTYRALQDRQMDFARGLARFGLPAETTVAVLVPRDGDMVALLLAILWCGLAYVPIDPEDPADRGLRIQNAAGCRLVIGTADLLAPLRQAAEPGGLSGLVEPADLIRQGLAEDLPDCAAGGDRLAYVLFTSGSTGAPKGVEIEHRQLVNLLFSAKELLGFGPGDRYLAVATIAFDISVVELFLPLITGGSLLLRDRSLLRDPDFLFAGLRDHQVSVVQFGPSSWAVLLAADAPFPHVRVAISTGEPIAPALARRLAAVADEAWNLYGPTEITVWATGHRLTADPETAPTLSGISAPIGIALQGYATLVADAAGNPVADGQDGELLIGGAGLARGYRSRPDLTAERFVSLGPDMARYYRTGDLVRRGPDGTLHYFGRNDDQIKVRGVRVEPREVEAAILTVPEVNSAAATWFEPMPGARGIVAGIVWAPGRALTFETLNDRLGQTLPRAFLPSRFVTLDDLPLTPSGKIDRNAIRNAAGHTVRPHEPGYARSLLLSDTEARLCMIWAKVLGLDRIDLDTHFFTEGGDSLSAIVMIQDVDRAFGVKLDPDSIYRAPRLHGFARIVERTRSQPIDIKNRQIVFPLVRGGRGAPLFFSNVDLGFAQEGRWQAGCPLYAMVQWSYGRGFLRANSIEDLARAQIAEIRVIQPHGPYRIGGYSMGGLIALEIARQLRQQAEPVELLFLLDPMAPVRFQAGSGRIEQAPGFRRPALRDRLWQQLRDIAGAPRTETAKALARARRAFRRLGLWQRAEFMLVDLYGKHPNALTRWLLPKSRWAAFWHVARKLAKSYVAKPYDGRCLAVFHEMAERHAIWGALLIGDARFEIVESSHLGMFTGPVVTAWMAELSTSLSEAELPAPPG